MFSSLAILQLEENLLVVAVACRIGLSINETQSLGVAEISRLAQRKIQRNLTFVLPRSGYLKGCAQLEIGPGRPPIIPVWEGFPMSLVCSRIAAARAVGLSQGDLEVR